MLVGTEFLKKAGQRYVDTEVGGGQGVLQCFHYRSFGQIASSCSLGIWRYCLNLITIESYTYGIKCSILLLLRER